jgi:hypothetical protein
MGRHRPPFAKYIKLLSVRESITTQLSGFAAAGLEIGFAGIQGSREIAARLLFSGKNRTDILNALGESIAEHIAKNQIAPLRITRAIPLLAPVQPRNGTLFVGISGTVSSL